MLLDDELADSFCLIPSKSDPTPAALKEENASLKAELEKQRQQLANMEMALKARQEQDQHLRDSIMLARKEVSSRGLVVLHSSHAPASILAFVYGIIIITGTPRDDLFQCDPATSSGSSSGAGPRRHSFSQYQRASPSPGACPSRSTKCRPRSRPAARASRA